MQHCPPRTASLTSSLWLSTYLPLPSGLMRTCLTSLRGCSSCCRGLNVPSLPCWWTTIAYIVSFSCLVLPYVHYVINIIKSKTIFLLFSVLPSGFFTIPGWLMLHKNLLNKRMQMKVVKSKEIISWSSPKTLIADLAQALRFPEKSWFPRVARIFLTKTYRWPLYRGWY